MIVQIFLKLEFWLKDKKSLNPKKLQLIVPNAHNCVYQVDPWLENWYAEKNGTVIWGAGQWCQQKQYKNKSYKVN